MKRTYNNKISVKANINMNRRAARVYMQKRLIAIAIVLIISLVILLGTSIKAFAGSGSSDITLYKYYTSIQVQPGDTLWGIAQQYTANTNVKVSDYIDEVRNMNHLPDDTITSGKHIVISYYSAEKK